MKINKIEVIGLFGAFDHSINLNNDVGITLLLGNNGVGKTQILKMIKYVFDRNFIELSQQLFTSFSIEFENDSILKFTRENTNNEIALNIQNLTPINAIINEDDLIKYQILNEKTIEFIPNDKFYKTKKRTYSTYQDELEYIVTQYLPNKIRRISLNSWFDETDGIIISSTALIDKYAEYFPSRIKNILGDDLPDWLTDIVNPLKVKIIETQRLLTKLKAEEGQYHSSVLNYSKELVQTIKNNREAAIDKASKLDRTFPNRIISSVLKQNSDSSNLEIDLNEEFNELNEKRELLNRVGLIDIEEEYIQPMQYFINPAINDNKEILNTVFSIYVQDSKAKLSTYNTLAKKIELLMETINKRFLYKKLSIEKSKGFVFTSTINGKEIPLSGLSSGEQHELVLFFQLLFTTPADSLLLIDEPEISLHISWQKKFIDDLKQVIRINNLSVVIATHSPDIIGNYWDLTVKLGGVKNDR